MGVLSDSRKHNFTEVPAPSVCIEQVKNGRGELAKNQLSNGVIRMGRRDLLHFQPPKIAEIRISFAKKSLQTHVRYDIISSNGCSIFAPTRRG